MVLSLRYGISMVYLGEPIVVAAAHPALRGTIVVSGLRGNPPWSVALTPSQSSEPTGVGALWARAKIASLMDELRLGAAEEAIRPAVVKVALEHHLVSRYTSLVAVDVTPSAPAGEARTYGELARMLDSVRIKVWEGAREAHDLFEEAHLALGKAHLEAGRATEALKEFNRALEYPENLATGKLENAREAHINYLRGNALLALDKKSEAIAAWKLAADEPHPGVGDDLEYRRRHGNRGDRRADRRLTGRHGVGGDCQLSRHRCG